MSKLSSKSVSIQFSRSQTPQYQFQIIVLSTLGRGLYFQCKEKTHLTRDCSKYESKLLPVLVFLVAADTRSE